jgi:hypothetical protein
MLHLHAAVYQVPGTWAGGPGAATACGAVPLPWPPGFTLVPAPPAAAITNHFSKSPKRPGWQPNPYILVMGPGYPPVAGRALWLQEPSRHHRALELPFSGYAIQFHVDVLDNPGVAFWPMFGPGHLTPAQLLDVGRQPADTGRLTNTVPRPPGGAMFAMYRRQQTRRGRPDGDTPRAPLPEVARRDGCVAVVVARPEELRPTYAVYFRCVFGAVAVASVRAQVRAVAAAVAAGAAGSPAAAVVPTPSDQWQVFQLAPSELTGPHPPVVRVAGHGACSPIMWQQALPGPGWPAGAPVVIVGVPVRVAGAVLAPDADVNAVCVAERVTGDVLTRFLADAMVGVPAVSALCDADALRLKLFKDKTPGMKSVSASAVRGTPPALLAASKVRPVRTTHACVCVGEVTALPPGVAPPARLPVVPTPDLDPSAAATNPFVQLLVTPEPPGTCGPGAGGVPDGASEEDVLRHGHLNLRGLDASMYDPANGTTLVAGSSHSWPVRGAILYSRIMRPWDPVEYPWGFWGPEVTPEARAAALAFLDAASYNATALETFWGVMPGAGPGVVPLAPGPRRLEGPVPAGVAAPLPAPAWACPGAAVRVYHSPYNMDVRALHAAVWWGVIYPGFPVDPHVPPVHCRLGVWALKSRARAVMDWLCRYGRVMPPYLNRRNRELRCDYVTTNLQGYCCGTAARAEAHGAPVGLYAPDVLDLATTCRPHLLFGDRREVLDTAGDALFDDEADVMQAPVKKPASSRRGAKAPGVFLFGCAGAK